MAKMKLKNNKMKVKDIYILWNLLIYFLCFGKV